MTSLERLLHHQQIRHDRDEIKLLELVIGAAYIAPNVTAIIHASIVKIEACTAATKE